MRYLKHFERIEEEDLTDAVNTVRDNLMFLKKILPVT